MELAEEFDFRKDFASFVFTNTKFDEYKMIKCMVGFLHDKGIFHGHFMFHTFLL